MSEVVLSVAPRSRSTKEEIDAKYKEVRKLIRQGISVGSALGQVGLSPNAYYNKCAAMRKIYERLQAGKVKAKKEAKAPKAKTKMKIFKDISAQVAEQPVANTPAMVMHSNNGTGILVMGDVNFLVAMMAKIKEL